MTSSTTASDLLGKGTMGLTLACARCHDHKFDPIPTTDYYALHGVFNSSLEPKEEPLLSTPTNAATYQAFLTEYDSRRATLDRFRKEAGQEYKAETIGKSAAYLLAIADFRRQTNNTARNAIIAKLGLVPQIAASWDNNMRNWENRHIPSLHRGSPSRICPRLSSPPREGTGGQVQHHTDKAKPINPLIARQFAAPPASLAQVAAVTPPSSRRGTTLAGDPDVRRRHRRMDTNAPPEPKVCPTPNMSKSGSSCMPTIRRCSSTTSASTILSTATTRCATSWRNWKRRSPT